MKGFSYPGKSPIKHPGHGDNDPTHTHTEVGDWDPYTGTYIAPKMEFGVNWGNVSGFKPIVTAEGWKKFAGWGKKQWTKSSTLGKVGIGLAHGAMAGAAIANPSLIPKVFSSIGKLFKGK